jgi:rod shape-determining protein MreC
MSYYFPENIIIGTIKSYKKSKSDGFYEIKVNLISNMSDISNVYVLENKNRDEIIDLENLSN